VGREEEEESGFRNDVWKRVTVENCICHVKMREVFASFSKIPLAIVSLRLNVDIPLRSLTISTYDFFFFENRFRRPPAEIQL